MLTTLLVVLVLLPLLLTLLLSLLLSLLLLVILLAMLPGKESFVLLWSSSMITVFYAKLDPPTVMRSLLVRLLRRNVTWTHY